MSKIDDFLEEALQKRAPIDLDELLDFYVLYAQFRGDSRKTISQTRAVINLLKEYLEEQGLSTNTSSIGHL